MNTIYSLIHSNLRRILAISLGAAGVVLVLYSFLSLKQTESQAIKFVTSHVAALAQAGINSQNVNEIDKEIARFTQTWKETQDLDLRVDIFLDGKLISHAGQLQAFKFLASGVEESINLPSGDVLRIKVEIGLEKFLMFGALLLAIFAVFIVAVFRVLTRSMQTSIKKLKEISRELTISAINNKLEPASTGILEIDELGASIGTLLRQIVVQEEHIAQINFDRGRIKMAEQVAHSIKGVIATIQLKTSSLKHLSDKERRELTEAMNTLREISGNLLRDKVPAACPLPQEDRKEAVHILPSIQIVVAAKAAQYVNRNVSIEIKSESQLFGAFSALDAGSLQTIFSSLIDNSVEAMELEGAVEIAALRRNQALELVVSDNGKGVPKHLLPLLMSEGATFGKANGNGIGLHHAKEILNRIGGVIRIESVEGKGAEVHLSIPLQPAPEGFVDRLEIPSGATLIMVDDDPLIHRAMDQKIETSLPGFSRIVRFGSAGEFENWFNENGPGEFGERVYFFDYDLKDHAGNGLDLIERHGLTFESVLISGMAEDATVKKRIIRLGVKWLPKDFLAQVPIFDLGGEPKTASFLGAV
jgi:signal transduction histidine kinase